MSGCPPRTPASEPLRKNSRSPRRRASPMRLGPPPGFCRPNSWTRAGGETEAKQPWTAPRTLEGTLEAWGRWVVPESGTGTRLRTPSSHGQLATRTSVRALDGVNDPVWVLAVSFTLVPFAAPEVGVHKTYSSPPRPWCHRRATLLSLDAHSRLLPSVRKARRGPCDSAVPPGRSAGQLGQCQVRGTMVSKVLLPRTSGDLVTIPTQGVHCSVLRQ